MKIFTLILSLILCVQVSISILENECCTFRVGFEQVVKDLESKGYLNVKVDGVEIVLRKDSTNEIVRTYVASYPIVSDYFLDVTNNILSSNPPPKGLYNLTARTAFVMRDPNLPELEDNRYPGVITYKSIWGWSPFGSSTNLVEVRIPMPGRLRIE